MMPKRILSLSLIVSAAAAISMAAACSSSSSGSSGTPTPTPEQFTDCALVWQNAASSGVSGNVDEYLIDVPVSAWAVGTVPYDSTNNIGQVLLNFDFNAQTADVFGLVTNGDFSLTAASIVVGDTVTMADSTPQNYIDGFGVVTANNGVVASGGTGSFTGVVNDGNSSGTPTLGSGNIAMSIGTGGAATAFNFGDSGGGAEAAFCETTTAFDPHAAIMRAARHNLLKAKQQQH